MAAALGTLLLVIGFIFPWCQSRVGGVTDGEQKRYQTAIASAVNNRYYHCIKCGDYDLDIRASKLA